MSILSPHEKLREAAPERILPAVELAQAHSDVLRAFQRHPQLAMLTAQACAPYALQIHQRPNGLYIAGDKPARILAKAILQTASEAATQNTPISPDTLQALLPAVLRQVLSRELAMRLEGILAPVRPMSMAQLAFMDDLLDRSAPMVMGVGPTGTGKTFLAIAAGISLLAQDRVKHLIITKPHEMLNGEIITPEVRSEKRRDEQFNVYFDILNDLIGHDEVDALIAQSRLEIAPLGLLRGRTFNDAFIVLDEAQNTNVRWMRLAATRSGQRSRMVITGDPSQTNLRSGEASGLSHLMDLISGTDIARTHAFEPTHIIRNDTVAQLEALYAKEDPSHFVELDLPATGKTGTEARVHF